MLRTRLAPAQHACRHFSLHAQRISFASSCTQIFFPPRTRQSHTHLRYPVRMQPRNLQLLRQHLAQEFRFIIPHQIVHKHAQRALNNTADIWQRKSFFSALALATSDMACPYLSITLLVAFCFEKDFAFLSWSHTTHCSIHRAYSTRRLRAWRCLRQQKTRCCRWAVLGWW